MEVEVRVDDAVDSAAAPRGDYIFAVEALLFCALYTPEAPPPPPKPQAEAPSAEAAAEVEAAAAAAAAPTAVPAPAEKPSVSSR